MKKILVIVFLLTSSLCTVAQLKNRLCLDVDMMFIPNFVYAEDFSQWGISYTRQFSKRSFISLVGKKWTTNSDFFLPAREGQLYTSTYMSSNWDKMKRGDLVSRKKFRSIDANYSYAILPSSKYGEVLAGAGLSYTFGQHYYIDTIIVPTFFPFDNYDVKYTEKQESYLGICPHFQYNYFMIKHRLILGVHVQPRKYFGLQSIQYDLGFHVGVNF